MKKCLALMLALAMILSLFSGCGREIDNSGYVPTGDAMLFEGQDPEDLEPDKDDQELTLVYYPDRSMNPLFGSDYTNRVLMSLIYQGLFAVDSKYNAHPILCSRYYVTPDYRTWTFYIDPNAHFSDGSPVTVDDVVASFNEARENDYYKGRFFYYLDRVEPSSDGGVDFFLTTPYEKLPMLLDIPILKASEVDAEHPLGTGPYMFSESVSGAHLVRDYGWWCGKTKVAATDTSIDLIEAKNPSQIRDEFEFGDVGLVCANPMSDSYAEFRCDYELWEIDSGYFMYIGCNITYSDFFDDGTLRTFLTYAIDREKLVEENYDGLALPATLPASPLSPYYNKSLGAPYGYDELKFIERLGRYKFPTDDKGVDKTLKLLVNADDSARLRCARDIAETLTELGMPCATLEYNTNAYKAALSAQNFDIYLGVTRLSATMDLTEYFRPWGELGSWGGIANETLLGMCKQALENSGNYYNLYKILVEDGRIIPVMFGYNAIYGRRGLLTDLSPSRDNVFFYTLGKSLKDIQVETVYE